MANVIEARKTILSEGEATYALREAYKSVVGEYPSNNSLAILWSQTALETGRFKQMYNYNWGNIKKLPDHDYCMYRCSEILNGKEVFFDPPHPQTHFCAYQDATAGAIEYLNFLTKKTRYQAAWQEVKEGNPVKYCAALKLAGYFTADLAMYTKGVVSLCNEFLGKSDTLLDWKPDPMPQVQLIAPNLDQEPPMPENEPLPEEKIGVWDWIKNLVK